MTGTDLAGTLSEAQKLVYAGRAQEALALLKPLEATHAASVELWQWLGYAYSGSNDLTSADGAFQRALSLAPKDPLTLYGLGQLRVSQGQLEAGIELFDRAILEQPNLEYIRTALVTTLMMQGKQAFAAGNLAGGEASYLRATKLALKDPRPSVELVRELAQIGDVPRARHYAAQGIAKFPAVPEMVQVANELQVGPGPGAPAPVQAAVMIEPQGAPVAAPQPVQPVAHQQIQCPACKRMAMEWASICPHCGERLKASAASVAMSQIPTTTWQEVAYRIVAVLWIASAVFTIVSGVAEVRKAEEALRELTGHGSGNQDGRAMYFYIMGGLQAFVGIGLLIENETLQFIAKIICYLSLFVGARGTVVGFLGGHPLEGLVGLAQLSLAGFAIYLINCVSD